ncbi:MAG: hypothetical protein JSR54_19585 [Proteobacteria bacterium]|nr:hypothetical protein [Pseudomonadota bacterium]
MKTTVAPLCLLVALAACTPTPTPAPPEKPAAGAAAPIASAAAEQPAARDARALTLSAAETLGALAEQRASALELGLLRLELQDAPRLKATLIERHVLRPHPQPLGAYTYSETGEVRVHLDDDWAAGLAAGRGVIAVRVDFGSFEEPLAAAALEDLKRRAAEAVAYLRTGLAGSNGCEPWEITPNGSAQGKCSYRLLEQRFFPNTRSGYAAPMDPARMHAVANLARAVRLEAVASLQKAGRELRRLTCTGALTREESRCEVVAAAR